MTFEDTAMVHITELFGENCPVSHLEKARDLASQCEDFGKWWNRADQGDWLLWTASSLGAGSQVLVATAAACARISLACLPKNREKAEKAIELAEAWSRGQASSDECKKCADELLATCMSPDAYGEIATAAMAAIGAAEAAVNAAGYSDDINVYGTLATNAARRAAIAIGRAEGEQARQDAHFACAEIVRKCFGVENRNGIWVALPLA